MEGTYGNQTLNVVLLYNNSSEKWLYEFLRLLLFWSYKDRRNRRFTLVIIFIASVTLFVLTSIIEPANIATREKERECIMRIA